MKTKKPTKPTRNFTRIDAALAAYGIPPVHRHKGKYLDAVCLHETPRSLCALASRLSHESLAKADPMADAQLLAKLAKAGDEHAKSLRGHTYHILIEAPRYFWPEMDTYRIGTQPMGSTSTMHKEAKNLTGDELVRVKSAITEDTLQARLWVFSEPTLDRIIKQRHAHRLPEWHEFCEFLDHLLGFTR